MSHRSLDRVDRRILSELQRQGDIGPAELSERLHLSASQCSRRIQRLKDEGYVVETVARLNRGRLHLGASAYVLTSLKSHAPSHAEGFHKLVGTSPEVLECALTTGEADFVLKICTQVCKAITGFFPRKS